MSRKVRIHLRKVHREMQLLTLGKIPGKNLAKSRTTVRNQRNHYFSSLFLLCRKIETVAENAAELLGEILYETPPEDPYTKEDLRNNNFSTRTTIEQPEIRTIQPTNSDSVENMSWYDTIP